MKQYLSEALRPEALRGYTQAARAYAKTAYEYAGTASSRASDFVQYLLDRARGFSAFDFAVCKVCLLSLGLWLGTLFASFFKRFRVFIFLGFIFSYLYLIWRVFLRNDND